MIILVPMLVAVVGLLLFVVTEGKLSEAGKIAFAAAMFALMYHDTGTPVNASNSGNLITLLVVVVVVVALVYVWEHRKRPAAT